MIRRVREVYAQDRALEEIDALLRVIDDQHEDEEATLALVPSILKELTRILDVAQTVRVEVEDLSDKMEEIEKDQIDVKDELARLSEKVNRPWWKRIFKV